MKLGNMTLRVPKNEASFCYFQFEAHENIVFHSTMDGDKADPYRDIQVFFPISLEKSARHIIDQLQKEFPIQILEDKIVEDSFDLVLKRG